MKKITSYVRLHHLVMGAGFFVVLAAVISCRKVVGPSTNYGLNPMVVVNPRLPSNPYSYSAGGDNNLVTLGRVLFYDKNLSLDKSVACGSCHQQVYGFADNKAFSTGFGGQQTTRNAHTIINTGNSLFWDGKIANNVIPGVNASGYEAAATTAISVPMSSLQELNIDQNTLMSRISELPYYAYLLKKAGGSSFNTVQSALGAFMANITANNSKYSKAFPSQGAPTASLTQIESDGLAVFNGKAKCALCHIPANGFSGNADQFEDIGLDLTYNDLGRATVTNFYSDRGRFHVPSLMNVGLTAPYMHDGRFKTLSEVVDFFDSGVQQSQNISSAFSAHPIHSGNGGFTTQGTVVPLGLTAYEKSSLVAFLQTLSDESITTDIRFSDPFKH